MMTGLKDSKSLKKKQITKKKKKKKNDVRFLTNQVRSSRLPYTSQIAEEAIYFFSVTLFRVAFYVRLNLAVLKTPEKTKE